MLRSWTARLAAERLPDYLERLGASVIPTLRARPGFAGVEFASRPLDDGRIEVLVISRWESADTAQGLAGASRAWVPDEIACLLDEFDDEVRIYGLERTESL